MSGSMAGEASPGSADASDGAAESTFIPAIRSRIFRSRNRKRSIRSCDRHGFRADRRSKPLKQPSPIISAAITPWQCQAAPWGFLVTFAALGIGEGHEVIAPSYSFRETPHAIALAGALPALVNIPDYWSGTIRYRREVEAAISERTRAIVASNSNGHPAQWDELRAIARKHNIPLIEGFDRS